MTQALATTTPKPQIMAGGAVAALVPQSLDEAFRVSQAIAASGLAPRGLDKPEQIMVAIMAGAELGLAPFQALQSFAVVNGRPTLWGDGLMAVARAQGIRAAETVEGEGDSLVATCEVTRPDTGETILRTFSVADAKKAGLWGKAGPWQSYPRRMLQMRARAYALRDGCADMLRGFQVREEVEDYVPVRDVTARAAPNLAARLAAPSEPVTEGFTVHNGLDPDDQIPDFDAAPPVSDKAPPPAADDAVPGGADDFPGDRPGEDATEPPSDDDRGSVAFDHIGWADRFIADLPFLTLEQLDALEGNKLELARFAQLRAVAVDKAQEFEAALKEARAAFA
jgi:hypothetical protein